MFTTLTLPGAEGPGGPEFGEWAKEVEAEHGTKFLKSMEDLPAPTEGVKRLCLVSGRTADNPRILGEAIKHGCTTIYLEKPGAPTVAEIEAMKNEASTAGVTRLSDVTRLS